MSIEWQLNLASNNQQKPQSPQTNFFLHAPRFRR